MSRVWTPEDEARLRIIWGGVVTEIAKALGRSPAATRDRAILLGLVKRRFASSRLTCG